MGGHRRGLSSSSLPGHRCCTGQQNPQLRAPVPRGKHLEWGQWEHAGSPAPRRASPSAREMVARPWQQDPPDGESSSLLSATGCSCCRHTDSGRTVFGANPPASKLLVSPPCSLRRTRGLCFWGTHLAAVLRSFSLVSAFLRGDGDAVCSRAEPALAGVPGRQPALPHRGASRTRQLWIKNGLVVKRNQVTPKQSQLLQKRRLQGSGPLRNREDQGGFAPHQPDWYLTLEKKHHQLEGLSSPRSFLVRRLPQSTWKQHGE